MAFYLTERNQVLKVIPGRELDEFCRKNGPEILLLVLDVQEGTLLPSLIARNRIPPGVMDKDGIGCRENMFLLLPEAVGHLVIAELLQIGQKCTRASESFELPHPNGEYYASYFAPPM